MMRLLICILQSFTNTFISLCDLFSPFHELLHEAPKIALCGKSLADYLEHENKIYRDTDNTYILLAHVDTHIFHSAV